MRALPEFTVRATDESCFSVALLHALHVYLLDSRLILEHNGDHYEAIILASPTVDLTEFNRMLEDDFLGVIGPHRDPNTWQFCNCSSCESERVIEILGSSQTVEAQLSAHLSLTLSGQRAERYRIWSTMNPLHACLFGDPEALQHTLKRMIRTES